jgi:hypothetical protein
VNEQGSVRYLTWQSSSGGTWAAGPPIPLDLEAIPKVPELATDRRSAIVVTSGPHVWAADPGAPWVSTDPIMPPGCAYDGIASANSGLMLTGGCGSPAGAILPFSVLRSP